MDPVTGAAIISAGGAIGSALLQNANARDSQKSAQSFTDAQQKRQHAWQERMSNTAYQRAASDLEAAGLNRILAIGSPSASPGGGMGSSSPASMAAANLDIAGDLSKGEQRKLFKEQQLQSMSQTDFLNEQAKTAQTQQDLNKLNTAKTAQDILNAQNQNRILDAEASLAEIKRIAAVAGSGVLGSLTDGKLGSASFEQQMQMIINLIDAINNQETGSSAKNANDYVGTLPKIIVTGKNKSGSGFEHLNRLKYGEDR